ncbi:MAG: hypothetical protein KBS63_02725 [Clostridiales bacterium]|nr:hypothetical protein [Candidatus Crickella caballi]
MRKAIGIILICAALILPFVFFDVLPAIGDPASAPNSHVSDYYIEHTESIANSPNMVTAVIVDFRAFDTLLETTVMFLAGVCVMIILAGVFKTDKRIIEPRSKKMKKHKKGEPVFRGINKDVTITVLQPIILVYAIYVLFHGEVSLGGGFQAGALIGTVLLLDAMAIPDKRNFPDITKGTSAMVAGIGTFIYALAGILTLVGGGFFLEYEKFPWSVAAAEQHSIGILMVEIGVTLGVAGTIVTIMNAILEKVKFDK